VTGRTPKASRRLGDDLHGRFVDLPELHRTVHVLGGHGEGGVGGGEHGVVDLRLHLGEGARDRQGAGDVGGVEGIGFGAGIDEDEIAVPDFWPSLRIQCRVQAWSPDAAIVS
jgi:hypothetical protein